METVILKPFELSSEQLEAIKEIINRDADMMHPQSYTEEHTFTLYEIEQVEEMLKNVFKVEFVSIYEILIHFIGIIKERMNNIFVNNVSIHFDNESKSLVILTTV